MKRPILAISLELYDDATRRADPNPNPNPKPSPNQARFQLQDHLQRAVGQAWAESAVEADAQVGLPSLPLIAKALLARSGVEQEVRYAELQSEHARLKQLCAIRDPELLASFESGARE